jgi:hypothetical protein
MGNWVCKITNRITSILSCIGLAGSLNHNIDTRLLKILVESSELGHISNKVCRDLCSLRTNFGSYQCLCPMPCHQKVCERALATLDTKTSFLQTPLFLIKSHKDDIKTMDTVLSDFYMSILCHLVCAAL